jgi:hypothetical protein
LRKMGVVWRSALPWQRYDDITEIGFFLSIKKSAL